MGAGIPVDKHPHTKTSALEGDFHDAPRRRQVRGRELQDGPAVLHGVGASVVNALSRELVATVKRDGATWEQRYKQGKPLGGVKKIGPARGSGTRVFFRPDSTIFPKTEFDAATIRERLEVASYLHKGLKVLFENEAAEGEQLAKETFEHSEGLADYLKKDPRRTERPSGARGGILPSRANMTKAGCVSIWCCNGRKRLKSTCAAT